MKILVIRDKMIGDAVLASPVCNTLKKTFPDSEIQEIMKEKNSRIRLYDSIGVDDVYALVEEVWEKAGSVI